MTHTTTRALLLSSAITAIAAGAPAPAASADGELLAPPGPWAAAVSGASNPSKAPTTQ